jgi:hypothetical protein
MSVPVIKATGCKDFTHAISHKKVKKILMKSIESGQFLRVFMSSDIET